MNSSMLRKHLKHIMHSYSMYLKSAVYWDFASEQGTASYTLPIKGTVP